MNLSFGKTPSLSSSQSTSQPPLRPHGARVLVREVRPLCVCVAKSIPGAPKLCMWAQRVIEHQWNPTFYVPSHFSKIQVAFKCFGGQTNPAIDQFCDLWLKAFCCRGFSDTSSALAHPATPAGRAGVNSFSVGWTHWGRGSKQKVGGWGSGPWEKPNASRCD